jgi:hypothetical protein
MDINSLYPLQNKKTPLDPYQEMFALKTEE